MAPLILTAAVAIWPGGLRSAPVVRHEQSPSTGGSCGVTEPQGVASHGDMRFDFDYGNDALHVDLWPNGVLRAGPLPGGGISAEIRPEGSIVAKLGWWREAAGKLTIEGERLDGTAPPLGARIPDGYGEQGFQSTLLTFPSAGCWRVVGSVAGRQLTFVVRVVAPTPSKPASDVWTSLADGRLARAAP